MSFCLRRVRMTSLPALLIVASCMTATVTAPVVALARDADRVIDLWPGPAPGETSQNTGDALPQRASENPPATRIRNITRPQLHFFEPPVERRNGAAVLVFPGGGYNYLVVDKEGSEIAEWLNSIGVTGIVVYYRTKVAPGADGRIAAQSNSSLQPFSERPLQDAQRAVSFVRQNATEWKLKPEAIGVCGFSAGGLTAALVATRFEHRAYEPLDATDAISSRPDFALLLYPWRLVEESSGRLNPVLPVSKRTPPIFFVHAHNDGISSLNSALLYAELRRTGVPSELHIYQSGGHGFGLRPVPGSDVDSWTQRAAEWLRIRHLTE